MHAVDVRMQALPVQEPEKNESPRDIKRADAEPVRNGDSFLAMIKKMIAAAKDGSKEIDEARFEDARLREDKMRDSSLQKETGRQDTEFSAKDSARNAKGLNAAETDNRPNSKEAYLKELKDLLKKPNNETQKLNSEHLQAEKVQKDIPELNLKILNEDFRGEIKDLLPQDVKEDESLTLLSDEALKNLDKTKKKKTQSVDEEKAGQAGALASLSKTDKKGLPKKISPQSEAVKENLNKKPISKLKPKISVEDLRSMHSVQSDVHTAGSESRVETDNSVDMVIDFSGKPQNASQGGDLQSTQNGSEAQKTNQSFSAMLAQEIRESAADFVQAGKIVLRDNNAGEIRLHLRPENLGSVKINLELSEGKRVTGTVTVASKEAYEAFEKNLDNLAKEFKENGFEFAEFNLDWSGTSGQDGFAENFESFAGFAYKNPEQDLRQLEKTADNLSTYSYVYGSTVDLLA
ncbi:MULTISPECIES: flagellar hook-length control protein FliK [unclassified Treponema]|uniref:flagellar hook-length control protein FliK n=1 Tax=unclassified Treponema TaxID=2638727 RepID=UPI0020A36233|nr:MULTISPECIES: flagellar hook-length control protein FliK [unclassified Treponema]UTC66487.1 flagellar hook-length control protein FliK [Treponema sp. OMZ 789]UTC69219.1 flagellar hook-length control protein FliK [Treponema sp. OMZ 790]UTC71932.1 flagellar hook-length control protein FliK [Treponema sp. OMZ 791]